MVIMFSQHIDCKYSTYQIIEDLYQGSSGSRENLGQKKFQESARIVSLCLVNILIEHRFVKICTKDNRSHEKFSVQKKFKSQTRMVIIFSQHTVPT